ncbi:importin-11-like [Sycon ciliatum]|uniref:importin-11-like n=1 Tax=Sycon ciliatum TaxID=27933 RepID=UPI0031F708BF
MDAVLITLAQATSQNPDELKPAEQQLNAWESELPGFYTILWAVFKNRDVAVNVRWMAILYLKNGIDRRWRQRVVFQEGDGINNVSITPEEKDKLRDEMLTMFDEPVNTLAVQLAVLIAKVFRLDTPKQWPQLLPHLIQLVKGSSGLILHRSIMTLKHVIKSMASWRLRSHRDLFETIAGELFPFALGLWSQQVNLFVSALQSTTAQQSVTNGVEDNCASSLELGTLSLRMLRQFAVHAFANFGDVQAMPEFMQRLLTTIDQLLAARAHLGEAHPLTEAVEKQCILCTKVLLDLLTNKPLEILPYLKDIVEFFCVKYLFAENVEVLLFERFIVQGLNFMKGMLLCSDYTPKVNKDTHVPSPNQDSRIVKGYEIKMMFFTSEVSANIVRQLVTRFFPLRQSEIDSWEDDPEGFADEEAGESWKFALRPCVETAFATLMSMFSINLAPIVASMVPSVQDLDIHDHNAVKIREAVYSAVGLAVSELYDEINFAEWFEQRLQHELLQSTSKYLRRRIIWLIGQWADVNVSQQLRPTIYPHLMQRLSADEDLVVRLEAAATLRKVVDGYQFETEDFLPFLENSSGLLFKLLTDVSECETKMLVLFVFSVIIQRAGGEVKPYAGGLIQYLPRLWEESVDHDMLRCSIVTVLSRIVRALGSMSTSLYALLMPIIAHCTDLSQPAHIYLLEDGLELWHLTLCCAPQCTVELLNLFNVWHDLLDLREHLNFCLMLLDSYLRLDAATFLQTYGAALVDTIHGLLNDVRPEAAVLVFRRIHSVFRIAPVEASRLFKPLVFDVLSCLLRKHGENSEGGQQAVTGIQLYELTYDGDYMPLLTQYIALLARVLLQNVETFVEVLGHYGQQRNISVDAVLMSLLDVWLEKFDAMPEVESRKLTALALSYLLPKFNWPAEQFGVIIDAIVDVLHQVHRCDEDGVVTDKLVYSAELCEIESDDDDTEEDKRIRRLRLCDPVHTQSLRDCTRQHLQQIQHTQGAQITEQLMISLDVDVGQQLKAFLEA